MITKVIMPKLSDAMETGKVIKWLKKEGETVKGGDVLVEVETDKANVEVEAFGSGVLRKIVIAEGGQVPVGRPDRGDRGPGGGHLERRRRARPAGPGRARRRGTRAATRPGRRALGRAARPPVRCPRWRATSRCPRPPR